MNTDKLEIDPISDAALGFALSCMNRMEELIADGMCARDAKNRTMKDCFQLVLDALIATDSEAAHS